MSSAAAGVVWVLWAVLGLLVAWTVLRFLLPLLLPMFFGPQKGAILACELKLFMGAFLGSNGFVATLNSKGAQVAAGQFALASELWSHFPRLNEAEFEKCRTYLALANDTAREPLPTWNKVVLFALTAAEMGSMSFAIALELSDRELSMTGSYVLAAVTAVIGGWTFSKLSVPAGQALYRHQQETFALSGRTELDADGKLLAPPRGNIINLDDSQSSDEMKPAWYRTLNRMGDVRSTGFWAFIALVVVVLVALMAFRFGSFADTAAKDLSAGESISTAHWIRGSAIFIFIGMLYVATQAWGILLGKNHGFCGTDSLKAKSEMQFKSTWQQFVDYQVAYISSCDELLRKWKLRAGDEVAQAVCVSSMAEWYPEAASLIRR